MGGNQQLALFVCNAICTEKAKKGEKKHRVWVRTWMERRVGVYSNQRELEASELLVTNVW